jgi:hypothetical protein
MTGSPSPVVPGGLGRRAPDLLRAAAERLTDRDRYLCRMLAEHRVLTTDQVVDIAFDSAITARHRLGVLTSLRLVDRFRPYRQAGSAPWHYVLDVLGAAVAWEDDETALTSWRRDKALAIATSSRLGHLVGTNGFFTALIRSARRSSGRCRLRTWRSERRCAAEWGDLVRPDGFGEWAEGGVDVRFFVEWDMGTERLERLAGKLPGYGDLAAVLGDAAWVLFALPTPRRENAARSSLKTAQVPVATAVLGPGESPAGQMWLPLEERRRRRLIDLGADLAKSSTGEDPHW